MILPSGPTLPATVYLPAVVEIDNLTLSKALGGQSRSVLSLWRKRFAFPPASPRRGNCTYTRTADVAAFLALHGRRIEWL